ncbi:MAG TPA: hypothetical protein VNS63_24680 [Blastocatellia bacterium]|nr:hypothetical protein [Blastocatellia bacterium]
MRRLLVALVVLGGLICGSLYPSSMTSIKASNFSNSFVFTAASSQEGHTIKITPWGPTQEVVDAARDRVLKNPRIKEMLRGAEHRVLSFELVESPHSGDPQPADSFKAIIFDYTNNRGFVCNGRLDGADLEINTLIEQPDSDSVEFDAAVAVVARDPELGQALRNGGLSPYRPMPPLVFGDAPVGKVNRTVAVGLMPKGIKYQNQIVGVDMIAKKVLRLPGNAHTGAIASPAVCGLPGAGQSTTGRGTAGQYNVVVSRNGVEIWNFIVVRPSASSGPGGSQTTGKGSAVELLNVNYRGKRLLTRAHVPILNVQYQGNACGPYRDWQYQEGQFTADGADVAPGIRMCTTPPQTILESGSDTGNFRGVAIYDNKEEVTLVSELEAGWYRYISRWTLTDGGVIKPRFGFGGVTNGCVCNIHTHHVYWRLDFDVNTATHNAVTDNIPGGDQLVKTEAMRPRIDRLNQTWTISNTVSGESVVLRPGPWDNNYDKYGKGDVWVLVNKSPNEFEDGVSCVGPTGCNTPINIAPFVNGEPTADSDIVVWYGAHFNHINGNVACGTSAGPDIEITRW